MKSSAYRLGLLTDKGTNDIYTRIGVGERKERLFLTVA